jgi:hypothetical protein
MSMKNLNDTIGNRFRHRPVCSAVPTTFGDANIFFVALQPNAGHGLLNLEVLDYKRPNKICRTPLEE